MMKPPMTPKSKLNSLHERESKVNTYLHLYAYTCTWKHDVNSSTRDTADLYRQMEIIVESYTLSFKIVPNPTMEIERNSSRFYKKISN